MPQSFFARTLFRSKDTTALEVLDERFADYLRSFAEETTLVLRAHLHLEQVAHEIHARFFVNPLDLERQGFAMTVRLLRAMNLVEPAVCDALNMLNEIRNGFAHSISSLSLEVKTLDKAFRASCSAMRVERINRSTDRELFIRWSAKLYTELIKARALASEMKRAMLREEFIEFLEPIDLSTAAAEAEATFQR